MKTNNFLTSSISVFLLLSSILTAVSVTSATATNPKCTAKDGDYIVSFNRNANLRAELSAAPGRAIAPIFTYESAINGFAANLSAEQVCAFQKRPNIELIEGDQTLQTQISEQPITDIWGLDRIDSTSKVYDDRYKYTSTGTGIFAYVVDTGINSKHVDFGSRVRPGFSAVKGSKSTEDCNGHGTHVAGTIGGNIYGVAKNVSLISVRVLSCSGSGPNSGVIAGLDWILKQSTVTNSSKVVNMSLGGGVSATLDNTVAKLTNAGITVVVAAGNDNSNACNSSPARAPSAITVAASDSNDVLASFSNFGDCVDVIAPGVAIKSTWVGSTTATRSLGGTSMASPHVAGAIARYLSTGISSATLLSQSTMNAVTGNFQGTPNRLLYLNPSN
jgi:subtilisin family serine protease